MKTEARRTSDLTELNGGSEPTRGGHSAFVLDRVGVIGTAVREQGCIFGFLKRRGICLTAEKLSTSHKGLGFIEYKCDFGLPPRCH